jgi:spermidine/putrescine-binding protein
MLVAAASHARMRRTSSSTSTTGPTTSAKTRSPAFEQATGIKVVYDTYDADTMLEAKVMAGGSDYDVVTTSTDFFSRQIKAGVYQPLDKSKLPNWKNLDPAHPEPDRGIRSRQRRTPCPICIRSTALPTTWT